MIIYCKQCSRWYIAKRKTRMYCCSACKQKAKRGRSPKPYEYSNPIRGGIEYDLSIIAKVLPRTALRLRNLELKFGFVTMAVALRIVKDMLIEEGLS